MNGYKATFSNGENSVLESRSLSAAAAVFDAELTEENRIAQSVRRDPFAARNLKRIIKVEEVYFDA